MTLNGRSDVDVLPEAFVSRLRQILPAPAQEAALTSFTRPPAVGFRINRLLADRQQVLDALHVEGLHPHPVAWWSDAFWLPHHQREQLLQSHVRAQELIYVQNLSSMIPPLVLAPEPGERVLDLTAAPGSKTLQMAGLMQNEGELAAVELVRGRFFKLRDNLKRQGATNVRSYLQNGERVWRYRPEHFDRVLLDAPCSSEGRFHVLDPDSYRFWSLRKIREMTRKQRRLLFSAIQALRPGGRLVYSTCAFAPEENEAAIAHALERFGDALQVEPIELPLENRLTPLRSWEGRVFPEEVRHAMRIAPSDTMEGFFVCRLRKQRSTIDP